MKNRELVMAVLLVISLVANAYMANERLEKKFYQKGLTDGAGQMAQNVVREVQKTGRLNVRLSNGQNVLLAAQKQRPNPSVPPPVNLHPVIESEVKDVNNQE